MNRATFFNLILLLTAAHAFGVNPPSPLPPLPTPRQLAWQDNNLALFIRVGISAATGSEATTSNAEAVGFNPARLDVQQWASLAKAAGFKRIILDAKDHDGFCLWPSKVTDFTVEHTRWRNGKGDLLREATDACKSAGLEFGVYVSPSDRHERSFGTADYSAFYLKQLEEVLSNYGPIDELRFEGVDAPPAKEMNLDWPACFAEARRLQPNCIIVSNIGPDARWNGNTIGHAGEPNWSTFDPDSVPTMEISNKAWLKTLNLGDPAGAVWRPCECFVPIRPTPPVDKLLSAFYKSTGRNCVLTLDVSTDEQGLISDSDAKLLQDVHVQLAKDLESDLAAGKPATASNIRGGDPSWGAAMAVDSRLETSWCTDDAVTGDCWLEADLGREMAFNTVALREQTSLGQRVITYRIEYRDGDQWKTILEGKSIGRLKYERFKPVTARQVRLYIEKSRACPVIAQFSVFLRSSP